MLFNSINFLIFFPIASLIYFIFPAKIKYLWLLIISYFYYMCWNAKYALLLLFSTGVTYLSGFLMDYFEKSGDDSHQIKIRKKWCVAGSFFLNLSVLFLFKYFDFAVDNINRLLSMCRLSLISPSFDPLLPVGISFYIFQALSYTMDIYRKEIRAEKNFLKYALFVSFFPQLVAGPIERSKNLLSQIHNVHSFNYKRMTEGLLIMLWGYFQKLVLADRIAIFVDAAYGNPAAYPGCYLLLASVLFAVQIYCDFSGYSLIAIGSARILGFSLMDNFNCPYLSASVAEFWRRWHISLTSWFRDYLYIPLGGNQKGPVRKYVNILTVFLVSGLWHGAQWTYVIWGALNGLFQIIGSVTKKGREKLCRNFHIHTDSIGHKCFRILLTFILVDVTWIFFRAGSITEAFFILKNIFTVHNPWIFLDGSLYTLGLSQRQFWLMIFAIGALIAGDILTYYKVPVIQILLKQDLWCRWLIYIGAAVFILIFGIWGAGYDAQAFVYFQF